MSFPSCIFTPSKTPTNLRHNALNAMTVREDPYLFSREQAVHCSRWQKMPGTNPSLPSTPLLAIDRWLTGQGGLVERHGKCIGHRHAGEQRNDRRCSPYLAWSGVLVPAGPYGRSRPTTQAHNLLRPQPAPSPTAGPDGPAANGQEEISSRYHAWIPDRE